MQFPKIPLYQQGLEYNYLLMKGDTPYPKKTPDVLVMTINCIQW